MAIDPDTAKALEEMVIYISICGTVAGVLYGFIRYSYLRDKSDNETYVARTQADIEKMQATKDLLVDKNYQALLDRRQELAKELIEKDSSLLSRGALDRLEDRLNQIIGSLPKFYKEE